MPDASWLTKAQAAEAIGCSTKTIEQLAQAGQLQQGVWRPQDRGPRRAVYHPADVARVRQERHPGAAPFVLAADPAVNGNGHPREASSTAIATALPSVDQLLRALVAAVVQAAEHPAQTSQTSQKSEKPAYVSRPEALAIAGISAAELRRAVEAGEVKQRGRTYRRRDLEAL